MMNQVPRKIPLKLRGIWLKRESIDSKREILKPGAIYLEDSSWDTPNFLNYIQKFPKTKTGKSSKRQSLNFIFGLSTSKNST